MTPLDWIQFQLGAVGLTVIVVDSTLFQPLRWALMQRLRFFESLLVCYLCVGVWAAAALSVLRTATPGVYGPVADILGTAVLCYAAGLLLRRLDSPDKPE